MTPGLAGDLVKGAGDIDHKVRDGLRAVANVAVPRVEDYGSPDPTGLGLALFRIVVHKSMGDIDHVGHPANGIGHRDVIRMDSRPGIGRKRRAE